MPLIADFHCHIYPQFSLLRLLDSAHQNFSANESNYGLINTQRVIALTERQDCSAFEEIYNKELNLPESYRVKLLSDQACLVIEHEKQPDLFLLAGHQINTIEKLELLAFACRKKIPSKLSWQETFAAIREAQGIPVINWAPGKWWFQRGKIIADIIATENNFILCDTALRFLGYPTPQLFHVAGAKNIACIAGSDPLPVGNEEVRVGSYCSLIKDFSLNLESPSESLRTRILQSAAGIESIGRRLSFMELLAQQFAYYRSGKGKR